MVVEGDRGVGVVRQVRGDVVGADLDLAVLDVLGMDEEDVVKDAEMLQERSAHEPVEVRAGDEPIALGVRGSHSWSHPPPHRRVLRELQALACTAAPSSAFSARSTDIAMQVNVG